MTKVARLLCVLLALVGASAAQAQEPAKTKAVPTVDLYCSAYDSFTKVPLPAHLTLMRPDSTVVDTATCFVWKDAAMSNCDFKVARQQSAYILHATLEGYDDLWQDYQMPHLRRNSYLEVPRLLMKRSGDIYKEVDLDGVVITGTKVKIQYRGDTIVYNAAAFNLPEGSMLDALVAQLPGAELKRNGDIIINGRRIDYLLLNGKDFFRGDNKLVLDNLPYYTVKELAVYDKSTRRSELLGRDVEKKDFVMDVRLKRDYHRNAIGNAETGLGTEDRYMARAIGMYFDDHAAATAFGNLNNLNNNATPGSRAEWDPSDVEEGRQANKLAGLHLQKEHPDKTWYETMDATARWTDADVRSETVTERFASDGNIQETSSAASRQKDFSLHVKNNLELAKPYNLSSLLMLDYRRGRGIEQQTTTSPSNLMRFQEPTRSEAIDLSGRIRWDKTLPWGDFVSVALRGKWNRNRPTESYGQRYVSYPADGTTDFRRIFYDNPSEKYDWSLHLDYAYSLGQGYNLNASLSYVQQFASVTNAYYRLDRLAGQWAQPDFAEPAGSLLHSAAGELWRKPTTRDELLLAYDLDNSDRSTGLTREYTAMVYLSRQTTDGYFSINFPLTTIAERIHYMCDEEMRRHRSDVFFRPSFIYSRWGLNALVITYELTPERPAFLDILPVDDTVNPLATILNNPNLKNRFTHTFNISKTWYSVTTEQSISLQASANIIQRQWGTRTTYNPSTGAYTYVSDNLNGNWMAETGMTFSRPLGQKKLFRIEQKANAGYLHSVDFDIFYSDIEGATSNARSRVNTLTLEEGLSLTFQRGTLTLSVEADAAWRHSTSARQGFQTINACDFHYGLALSQQLPWRLQLATDLTMFSRRGYQQNLGAAKFNDDRLVWNAQLSRSLLRDKLTLKLQAFDLLHQLTNRRYEVDAQGRTQTSYNNLPRYLMLTIACRFSAKPKKQ